jgi:hypothetical protein
MKIVKRNRLIKLEGKKWAQQLQGCAMLLQCDGLSCHLHVVTV